MAAKLVRLKTLLPNTDVPALVARHTGLLEQDPAAMASSLQDLRCVKLPGAGLPSGHSSHQCCHALRLNKVRNKTDWHGSLAFPGLSAIARACSAQPMAHP